MPRRKGTTRPRNRRIDNEAITLDKPNSESLYILSCVFKKGPTDTARSIYQSPWFERLRTYIESEEDIPWRIVSAHYGLLLPGEIIAPYEKFYKNLSRKEQHLTVRLIRDQMKTLLPPSKSVHLFLGEDYRKTLSYYFRKQFQQVIVPMERVEMGDQLHLFQEYNMGAEQYPPDWNTLFIHQSDTSTLCQHPSICANPAEFSATMGEGVTIPRWCKEHLQQILSDFLRRHPETEVRGDY